MAAGARSPDLPDDFYRRIKARLHKQIGRELRLAGTVVDLGCGSCDLAGYLAQTYRQKASRLRRWIRGRKLAAAC